MDEASHIVRPPLLCCGVQFTPGRRVREELSHIELLATLNRRVLQESFPFRDTPEKNRLSAWRIESLPLMCATGVLGLSKELRARAGAKSVRVTADQMQAADRG